MQPLRQRERRGRQRRNDQPREQRVGQPARYVIFSAAGHRHRQRQPDQIEADDRRLGREQEQAPRRLQQRNQGDQREADDQRIHFDAATARSKHPNSQRHRHQAGSKLAVQRRPGVGMHRYEPGYTQAHGQQNPAQAGRLVPRQIHAASPGPGQRRRSATGRAARHA